jgi:predicted transcriptional regulator
MAGTVSTRIDEDLLADLQELQDLTHEKRSDILRDTLAEGIAARRLRLALRLVSAGELSLGRGAALARLPLADFLGRFAATNTLLPYDAEQLAEDIAWADRAR